MTLHLTKKFIKDYNKLPKQIRKQIREKIDMVNKYGFRYPSLRFKPIEKYKRQGIFELSVTMNYRIIVRQINQQQFDVIRVGTHDILDKI